MRVTGAGNPLTPYEQTLPGKLPQRKITTGAAAGYSSYGNQIGLATGLVAEVGLTELQVGVGHREAELLAEGGEGGDVLGEEAWE